MVREFGKRAAMNSPIQGTAADIMKIAMNKVYDELIKAGFDEVTRAVSSGKYELVILDELNMALHFGLIGRSAVEERVEAIVESYRNQLALYKEALEEATGKPVTETYLDLFQYGKNSLAASPCQFYSVKFFL